jgi:hypothetical protein
VPGAISTFFRGFISPHPFVGGITLGGFSQFKDGPNMSYVCESADIATGSSNSMLLMPQHGVGLFVSFNCCSGHGMHRVNPTLFERFLDHFYPMPAPTPAEDDAARFPETTAFGEDRVRDFVNPNSGGGGLDPKALVEWQPPVGPIASALCPRRPGAVKRH